MLQVPFPICTHERLEDLMCSVIGLRAVSVKRLLHVAAVEHLDDGIRVGCEGICKSPSRIPFPIAIQALSGRSQRSNIDRNGSITARLRGFLPDALPHGRVPALTHEARILCPAPSRRGFVNTKSSSK